LTADNGGSKSSDSYQVLVTLPARNEATRLVSALKAVDKAFRASGLDFQLSVAEDGSTDGTKEILPTLSEQFPGLLIQEGNGTLGRGRALRHLWSRVHADIYCFTDVDLAAGERALVAAVQMVADGSDVVTGSRYAPGAHTTRPYVRSAVSRCYNLLLRSAFHEGIRDHQCGLKAFSREAITRLLPLSREDSWFWDTEMLVLALSAGYPVVEMPVTWTERKTHRTSWARLASDVYLHGTGMVRLAYRTSRKEPGLSEVISRAARGPKKFGNPEGEVAVGHSTAIHVWPIAARDPMVAAGLWGFEFPTGSDLGETSAPAAAGRHEHLSQTGLLRTSATSGSGPSTQPRS
jgi:glycosyltransferase AglD